ncbi:hypothetical protein Tco_0725298 [Tanacetum coccineum]|uniref:Reverse transcriptase domain-containing protein n=1 Tax=Tanacetum coccineum TaxID=301880 RepID=A0ABQ4YEW8_9ASTR
MPPRRFKKKSVKRIVEKRVAKAIEEYEKTRADSNNTGGSGSANTGGTVAPDVQGCSYKTFMNGKPHSFSGTEGVVGLKRWFEKMEQVFEICKCAEDDKGKGTSSACSCPPRCGKCHKLGHQEGSVELGLPVAGGNSGGYRIVTCFGCGNSKGTTESDCSDLGMRISSPKCVDKAPYYLGSLGDHHDNPLLTNETESEPIIWDIEDEEEEYPYEEEILCGDVGKGFVDNYPNFQEEENNVSFSGVVLGVEEESMPVYDTDIEDVIEEEERFVGK